jgi:hypothetical protein
MKALLPGIMVVVTKLDRLARVLTATCTISCMNWRASPASFAVSRTPSGSPPRGAYRSGNREEVIVFKALCAGSRNRYFKSGRAAGP